ncbi:MAG: site-specific integrase, partial [Planctomycetes bacterium]|nr:site-specific integrase [Planctomycetota bacterium]
RVRRALSDDELSALLDAAGRGPVRFGLSGPARRALYLAAVATGFRSGELRSLAPEAFDWTGDDGPTVALEAGSSKNRRAHVQPLASWAVAELRAYVTACPPRRPVWQLRRDRAALMLGDDLDAARAAWIDAGGADAEREQRRESDYLRRVDSLERRVDFHSLRACGVSRLLRAGVGIHLVQRWARHCSPVLTMRHYAQIGIGDLRGALDGARLGGAPPNRAAGPRAAAG